MPVDVWLHSYCPHLFPEDEVVPGLEKSGLAVSHFHPDSADGPGIVVMGEVTPQACSFIRIYSQEKDGRILAVVVDGTGLDSEEAWQIMQAGASDVLSWGDLPDPASTIAARFKRWKEVDDLVASSLVTKNLVGQSWEWKSVVRRIVEAARFTDAPVLLVGETGTGKELATRLIHTLDRNRHKKELVVLDCTTIVPELSGSELFGHVRGAFTGAIETREGAFAIADGGTLFLDEVGELPPGLQIQLLRVLQERTYKQLGNNHWRHTDFRLICATNRDLNLEQERGQFRRDLYYRIANWVIRMPPLRERVVDILPLTRHFIRQIEPDDDPPELDDRVREYFLQREYPGNVRDLKNLVFRIMARHVGPGPITLGDIPSDERPQDGAGVVDWRDRHIEQAIRRALNSGLGLRDIRREIEEISVRVAVDNEGGNLQRAADRLGVTDRTLQKRRAQRREHIRAAMDGKN